MNLLKSLFLGHILSPIPMITLTLINYKYSNKEDDLIFGIYSFYMFDLLFLILFYILNYRKNNLINYNKNLIFLCVLSGIILSLITYFTSKNIVNKVPLGYSEIDSFEENKDQDFIYLFFEFTFSRIIIYYISLYFYNNKILN